jgi:cell division protein FtsQ
MISRNPTHNKRRSGGRLLKTQGLLEVKVRSEIAHRQRNRAIVMVLCKLILAILLVGGAVYGGRAVVNRMFLHNPEYNLAAVEITDDGGALARELVLSTANLTLGQNIFTVSLAKAREALAKLPQVDHVDLQRSLPNKIIIDITERRPVAWLAPAKATDPSSSEKSFLVDSKGVLFRPKTQLPEYLRLPAIYGVPVENYLPGETVDTPEVCAALELVQKNSDANRFRLQSLDLSLGYCMIATDAKRAKLTFGIDDIGRQLDRLGAVLDYASAQGKEIRKVNLMVERNIPAILADPAAPPAPSETPESGPDQEDAPKTAVAAATPAATPEKSAPKEAAAAEKTAPKSAASKTLASKTVKSKASSASLKKKFTAATQNVQRAEPVIHRAEPIVRRAELAN